MKSSRKKNLCSEILHMLGQFRTEDRGVVLPGSVVYKALGCMLPNQPSAYMSSVQSLILFPWTREAELYVSSLFKLYTCNLSNHYCSSVNVFPFVHYYQRKSKLEVLPCQSQAGLQSSLTGTSMFLNTQAFSVFQPTAMPQARMVSLQVSIFNCHNPTKALKLSSNASFSIKVFPHTPSPSIAAPEFPPTLCWPFPHN